MDDRALKGPPGVVQPQEDLRTWVGVSKRMPGHLVRTGTSADDFTGAVDGFDHAASGPGLRADRDRRRSRRPRPGRPLAPSRQPSPRGARRARTDVHRPPPAPVRGPLDAGRADSERGGPGRDGGVDGGFAAGAGGRPSRGRSARHRATPVPPRSARRPGSGTPQDAVSATSGRNRRSRAGAARSRQPGFRSTRRSPSAKRSRPAHYFATGDPNGRCPTNRGLPSAGTSPAAANRDSPRRGCRSAQGIGPEQAYPQIGSNTLDPWCLHLRITAEPSHGVIVSEPGTVGAVASLAANCASRPEGIGRDASAPSRRDRHRAPGRFGERPGAPRRTDDASPISPPCGCTGCRR
ncbi:MAG: hypothetical protein AVDCRST_MAG19-3240 [uncultured Thermomicrobiales bacterium]|uniref:Uncharacterized protein n=1 Tax=uncultured Thermomicrobiales bacterium TaxID=1645740 RepID=A0A6J4VGD9_9BACT|nr:MAG: hypothetical protein AVDCRST_MAG19-3240 [uncultured Thermomicrobiales bacterium]